MLSLLKFQNALEQLLSQSQQKTYLLAVSGGVDSMVLADLFQHSGYHFQVAHVNYHLRGEDSNRDQELVSDFCSKHGIPFHWYEVSEEDGKPANSIQNWARELRYRFFRKIQQEQNLEYIVTAHHLNDQLETFMINLSKAAGIQGLSGIPANENGIVRPLLGFSKQEIYEFANQHHIEFREDLSNQKSDYLRNKIRHHIVPQLEKINDHFLQNFAKSMDILNQTKNVLNDWIDEKIKAFETNVETGQTVIDKTKFSEESDLIRFEILKNFGFKDEKEMQKIFTAQTGSTFFNSEYQLIVNRNELILNQRMEEGRGKMEDEEIALEMVGNEIVVPENIKTEIREFGNCNWKIDNNKINLPLKLRKKRSGDTFFPIGLAGKKKIAKFFKDEKLSILAKRKIWLLCDANDQILGVLPFRQDGRFHSNDSESLGVKI
ncbi:MAG: tRNA lysidine(34) synthetase TilS [Weeksellaceae bacterium]|nr:tRNA lysidine(34) synthetase TilS [Weeksellaceae bacterium]